MHTLNTLIADAKNFETPSAAVMEVQRVLQICNACRYCEGFCATFQSMTRRLEFNVADVHFMANLCHNCGACLHACQYAPPNEFGVNIPQAMAKVRLETYQTYAWPQAMGRMYQKNGLALMMLTSIAISLFLLSLQITTAGLFNTNTDANFYAIFPHNTLAVVFGSVFIAMIIAMTLGVRQFWARVSTDPMILGAAKEASYDALTLKNLGGGHQQGCNESDDAFSLWRRRFHHMTFYGFMLCFAATSVATLFHYFLGWQAPYSYTSLPVILGKTGRFCINSLAIAYFMIFLN
jgi:citrate/tricarballylate utilization protein